MKSIAYSNDIKKNVLKKEKNIAQRDEDYESTFIWKIMSVKINNFRMYLILLVKILSI